MITSTNAILTNQSLTLVQANEFLHTNDGQRKHHLLSKGCSDVADRKCVTSYGLSRIYAT